MKKKYWLLLLISGLFMSTTFAQVFIGGRIGGGFGYGGGYGGGYGHRRSQSRPRQTYPTFKPEVYVSFGYGFPNLDANQLSNTYTGYSGNISQTGPITGSIDYRFSRSTSIGIMTTYGKASVPYYSYGNNAYQGSAQIENWSVMFNLMQYAPINNTATMYFRGALGLNIPTTATYTDFNGNTSPIVLPDLAYQISLGGRFKLTDNTAFFAEAGYGKYILLGGLSFTFK